MGLCRANRRIIKAYRVAERMSSYLAWGRDVTGVYHGIWGHMGVARTMESTKGAKLKKFKEIMLRDAEGFIDELRKVRMIKEGMFHAGHA